MYEYVFRRADSLDDGEDPAAVTYHEGDANQFLQRHQRDAERAIGDGIKGVRSRAQYLFSRIADPRALRLAWDHLARNGGSAPGLNGHRYVDYHTAEIWDLCRCLGKAIRQGIYRPGREKVRWIDKESKNGKRPLVLLDIEDRVVQRTIVLILQPLLDPLFDSRSFGYRPRLGHLPALALAENLALSQRRYTWIVQDIRDAFSSVPLSRLLDVVQTLLPADDLIELLKRVLPGEALPGLRQGGPLSPLMLNLYLNHFLDRPWRKSWPQCPLIRVADDLLVLCRTRKEALGAHAALARLLLPAGMPLKWSKASAINSLGKGDQADWLGFSISKVAKGLAIDMAKRSWRRLERYLALAHTKSDSPLRAIRTITQWLNQRGPCYPWCDRDKVYQRIKALARRFAFEEIPSPLEMQQRWQRAYARWRKRSQASLTG